MASPYVKNINTFTDFGAESKDIDRRRKLAELLQQSVLEPIKQETAGGQPVPISWTQHLAKLLQGGMGAYKERQLKEEASDLAKRQRDTYGQEAKDFMTAMQGEEAVAGGDDYGNEAPGIPAMPADRNRALQMAMSAQNQILRAASGPMLAGMLETPKGFTLAKDAVRFGPDGKPIATNTPPKQRKLKFVDTGNAMQAVDSSTGEKVGPPFAKEFTPNQRATLMQRQHEWGNVSPSQWLDASMRGQANNIAAAGLANTQSMNRYNTGQPPPVPIPATGMPQMPPTTPQPRFDNAGNVINQAAMPQQGQRPAMPSQMGSPPGSQPTGQIPAPIVGVTPKQRNEWEAEKPQANAHIKTVDDFIGGALREVDFLLGKSSKIDGKVSYAGHEGLKSVTGSIEGIYPGLNWREDATNANAAITSLQNKLSGEALRSMRESSKAGGAVGQVTEREWDRLANLIGTLDTRQGAEQFKERLIEIRDRLNSIKNIAHSKYNEIYSGAGQQQSGNPYSGMSDDEIKKQLGL